MERRAEGERLTPLEIRAEIWRAFDKVSEDGGRSARALEIIDELVKAEPPIVNCADCLKRRRIHQLVCGTMLKAKKKGEVMRESYCKEGSKNPNNAIWRRAE